MAGEKELRIIENVGRPMYPWIEVPQIVYRKTVDLDALHNNPRFIRDEDFKSLCKSLSENPKHLTARPLILSDRTGLLVVISGNMRLKACVELGIKEVPTVLLQGLTEEEEQQIIIRENVSNGSWDYDALANGEWNLNELIEWGVPALWDLNEEDEDEAEPGVKEDVAKLTIIFKDFGQMNKCRTELEELLRNYPGAELK